MIMATRMTATMSHLPRLGCFLPFAGGETAGPEGADGGVGVVPSGVGPGIGVGGGVGGVGGVVGRVRAWGTSWSIQGDVGASIFGG